jgi:hypothetical protein
MPCSRYAHARARSRSLIPRFLTPRFYKVLERRLVAIGKLDPKANQQTTQLLDTFIDCEKLTQRVNAQGA